ncbi:unnamed protein product [Rotaria socialis]|uniref:Uncharacterized protein n=1 Tax=Rotaria socialis TaxID=392032 RepID=A0A817TAU6_9BILA|nr:unnamed protein product [Rotaria socialis]CAF3319883.1 unnamed protein product [Rotaria socialis]CAF3420080.1 unnamed protein product [Rotaria socialis]CAF3420797.1 unnamed protein product [Rotaria socialis]CAF3525089.1 unnamed protein product [Rotaria socialis]
MGNTANRLSLCVSQSSRKTRRERPYVSRPYWQYQYENHLNISTHMSSDSQIREISPTRLSPIILHDNSQSRSMHIIKMT